MADLIAPHDRFFKEALSQHDAAVDFLRYYLPAEVTALLDLSTIDLIKDSFVDEALHEHFSGPKDFGSRRSSTPSSWGCCAT